MYLYILHQTGSQYYKIGITTNPEKRFEAIQSCNPQPLNVAAIIEHRKAGTIEIVLHEHFKNERVRNEWFLLSSEQLNKALKLIINYTSGIVNIPKVKARRERLTKRPTPYNKGKVYSMERHQKKQLNKVNKAYTRLYKKEGKRPTYTALADATGLDRRTVKKYVSLIETNNP